MMSPPADGDNPRDKPIGYEGRAPQGQTALGTKPPGTNPPSTGDKPIMCWGPAPPWTRPPGATLLETNPPVGTVPYGTNPLGTSPPGAKPSHHVSQVDHGLGEVAGENHGLAELQELGGQQGTGWAGGAHRDPHPTPRTPRLPADGRSPRPARCTWSRCEPCAGLGGPGWERRVRMRPPGDKDRAVTPLVAACDPPGVIGVHGPEDPAGWAWGWVTVSTVLQSIPEPVSCQCVPSTHQPAQLHHG